MQWKIILYRNPSGDHPVQEFIDSLEIKAQSKVQDSIKLLREFGIRLGSPHIKKFKGTIVFERQNYALFSFSQKASSSP